MNIALSISRRKKRSTDPGHFYSPIPDLDEIRHDEARIFGSIPRTIAGIDLHEEEQLALLSSFADYYLSMPFGERQSPSLRYRFENPAYSYSDAIMLHCMIRHASPKRIIEVGSGYSSCVTLDTNELFFGNRIHTSFIEPYPELLLSLVKDGDRSRIRVIPSRLQNVALEEFDALEENDILFVDSTHVCKTGSDVNRIFFDILPKLRQGVYVHFHDIFFPFEYPKEWIYRGRAWNEAYLLRAFLQYNAAFRVVLMNTFMQHFHETFFREKMPLCLKNPGGSIWLRRE
ncbi:MAG: class I SAM-dependent methyltransferase [Rhodocyclaceae bacterium]|jgi:hypothetical protein|nr:class I SAM-dependent methyltransferase [Rhodocyclaceae bacterium]GIK47159.1 MAG: hypothetical protein BroJett012_30620 [Betaproteobacteria bacterium]